jgi:uncharacterized membrane protein YphA (DoxX/SURF4 family)
MSTKLIEWVLRISVAGEFIGHGVFAVQDKKDWIGWFANSGFPMQAQQRNCFCLSGSWISR